MIEKKENQDSTYTIEVILPINAVAAMPFWEGVKEEVEAALAPNFSVTYSALDAGATSFIQSRTSEEINAPFIKELAKEAAENGADAIFVSCFAEPAVEVLKEQLDLPIVGGFTPAIHQAQMVASKFSIITVVKSVLPMLSGLAKSWSVENHICSILDINIPVSDLDDISAVREALLVASKQAIDRDGAEAIVLGCTGMLSVTQWVTDALQQHYKTYIPVIAPTAAAINAIQSMILSGVRPSRLTYFKSA